MKKPTKKLPKVKRTQEGALPEPTLPQKIANGKIETGNSIFEFMYKKEFPYEQKTIEEYRASLDKMALGDLHAHAVQTARIVPNVDRNKLIRRLEDEYLKRQTSYLLKYLPESQPQTNLSPEAEKSVLDILNRRAR